MQTFALRCMHCDDFTTCIHPYSEDIPSNRWEGSILNASVALVLGGPMYGLESYDLPINLANHFLSAATCRGIITGSGT